ncbi:MAG: NosD domain-containing protein [Candidatus Woesearchaeota archaeon]
MDLDRHKIWLVVGVIVVVVALVLGLLYFSGFKEAVVGQGSFSGVPKPIPKPIYGDQFPIDNFLQKENLSSCKSFGWVSGTIYTLNQSISFNKSGESCMVIDADNVVLDCQGHSIRFISSASSVAIKLWSKNNFFLQNCNITGFRGGIDMYNSSGNMIRNNFFETTESGVNGQTKSNSFTLFNNSFKSNKYGVKVESSTAVNVLNNTFRFNKIGGLYFTKIINSSIQGNSFSDGEGDGIYLELTNSTLISFNNITKKVYGVKSIKSHNNIFVNNIVNYNLIPGGGGTGFYLEKSDNNNISGNIAKHNGRIDFNCSLSSGNYGTNNDFTFAESCGGWPNQPFTPIDSCDTSYDLGSSGGKQTLINIKLSNKTYVLTENLSTQITPCFTVGANNLILDCQGHSIGGLGTGLDIKNQHDILVQNCVFKGMGISAEDSKNLYFYNNSFNTAGISLTRVTPSYIVSNSFADMGMSISLNNIGGALISKNYFVNPNIGIYVKSSNNSLITSNTFINVSQRGIHLFETTLFFILGNNIVNQVPLPLLTSSITPERTYGVFLQDSFKNVLGLNTILGYVIGISFGTPMEGKDYDTSNFNVVANNSACGNRDADFYCGIDRSLIGNNGTGNLFDQVIPCASGNFQWPRENSDYKNCTINFGAFGSLNYSTDYVPQGTGDGIITVGNLTDLLDSEGSTESCLPYGDVYKDNLLDTKDLSVLQLILQIQTDTTCGAVGQNYCYVSKAYVCKNGIVKQTIESDETCQDNSCTPLGDVMKDGKLDTKDLSVLQLILQIQTDTTCGATEQDYCYVSKAYVCKNGIVKQTIGSGEKC